MKLKALSQETRGMIEAEFPKYPDKQSVLLHALWMAQKEVGYLSESAMEDVAEILDLTPVQVYDVATFYTLYNLTPVGKYVIYICKTLPCALVGAMKTLQHLRNRLQIDLGETTGDGLFTLRAVECLAACGSAPMMQINDDYYEQLTPTKVDRVLSDLRKEGRSSLASGPFRLPMWATSDG